MRNVVSTLQLSLIVPDEVLNKHLSEKYSNMIEAESNPILLFYKMQN